MGKILQKGIVQNLQDVMNADDGMLTPDKIRAMEVEFLVDTGAAMVCLPRSIINALGLKKRRKQQVITATGEREANVHQVALLTVLDREAEMPVMELPNDVPPLLGYLALEALDLYPNPHKQILEGNPKYDGKMVIDLL